MIFLSIKREIYVKGLTNSKESSLLVIIIYYWQPSTYYPYTIITLKTI